jgi:hypothetical protein
MNTQEISKEQHKLNNSWRFWAHLPHDTDWTLKSYKNIYKISTVEEAIVLFETIPEKMVKNCMLFVMKDGIQPLWEDPKNRNGGCFSYKISNKTVVNTWKQLAYTVLGETLTVNPSLNALVNGITISPKKNFCIIKVWLSDCSHQNPSIIREVSDIVPQGCLFKKHTPEY